MSITLTQILNLVGKLDDSPGENTSRERFRQFLKENVEKVGQIRDYVDECLRISGTQYNRALQDLVNYLGHFLGFKEVTFGRYQGVPGEIGFDGHWKSPTGFHIVVEVKTTEAYAIKAATLVNYVNELISEKEIPSWDKALGLYVVGRSDPELRQLENAVVAEKRKDQLRIISGNSLLSLAELMDEYDVSHEDILAVLRPSGPTIDPIVELIGRLVAQEPVGGAGEKELPPAAPPTEEEVPARPAAKEEAAYWLTPVRSEEDLIAKECIKSLVGEEKIYALGERTPGRKHLKPGDWICFYAQGEGVVAHAKVASYPKKKRHPKIKQPEKHPWLFKLDQPVLYLDEPVVIDATLRNQLDAFADKDLNKSWAWFVQSTSKLTKHDFEILTRGHD
ncbi:hypothetical protein ES703_15020 [subsurface metagenome]